MNRLVILFLSILIFSACDDGEFDSDFPDYDIVGYVPVYSTDESVHEISIGPAKSIQNPGKIFLYNQYLMVNIRNEGFHVIDNSNPAFPRKLFFVNVPGNNDVAIKNGMLYADNYEDIVVFRITENQEVEIMDRLENVMLNQEYPPVRGVYFECVDPEKGTVIDWKEVRLRNAECYRP